MKIDWWTLALQAVNFLVLVWLLSRFLFTPVREVIEKRKALSSEAFAKADAARARAEEEKASYERDRAGLEKERMSLRKTLRQEMEDEQHSLLKEAQRQATEIRSKAEEEIGINRRKTLTAMREEIIDLAADMASTLLKHCAAETYNELFLKSLVNQLSKLTDEEREHLNKDLSLSGKGLTVITAAPLSPEEQKQWQQQIARNFKKMPKPHFTTDAGLVGGTVLRFPHAELRFSWNDQLEEAKNLLLSNKGKTHDTS